MTETIILIIAAFATSMISAVIGMGGGITLLGIMALLIPEGYMVVALHGVIQLVSNTTRTTVFRAHIYRPIIRQFTPGIILGFYGPVDSRRIYGSCASWCHSVSE